MRDVDLETLLAQKDIPAPRPQRRNAAKARALEAFDVLHHRGPNRGVGAAVARALVRSSAPAWRLISDIFENPHWNSKLAATVCTLATSLVALAVFTAALIAALMLMGG